MLCLRMLHLELRDEQEMKTRELNKRNTGCFSLKNIHNGSGFLDSLSPYSQLVFGIDPSKIQSTRRVFKFSTQDIGASLYTSYIFTS